MIVLGYSIFRFKSGVVLSYFSSPGLPVPWNTELLEDRDIVAASKEVIMFDIDNYILTTQRKSILD